MSQELIDHSSDLKRLVDEGYSLEIRSGYVSICDVPYINAQKKICFGTLICALTLAGNKTSRPSDHVMYFIGEHPCNADGSVISGIVHTSTKKDFGDGIVVDHSFSNKPPNGFENYYDKFVSYFQIIFASVHLIDPTVTAQAYKPFQTSENSVFNYRDSNSSRANIGFVTDKMRGQKIGIVGLGGTGAYILDMVAKTPVEEIHLFDGDRFYTHNAFRAPGAASKDELEVTPFKTDYFASIYGKMRKGIESHTLYLGEAGLGCLLAMSFVFLSLDPSTEKKFIIESLVDAGIPLIDTGIGINHKDDFLFGAARITTVRQDTNDSWKKRISYIDAQDDVYASNIQIAEINNLCATLAIIKWKKLSGVYFEQGRNDFTSYDINMGEIVNEN